MSTLIFFQSFQRCVKEKAKRSIDRKKMENKARTDFSNESSSYANLSLLHTVKSTGKKKRHEKKVYFWMPLFSVLSKRAVPKMVEDPWNQFYFKQKNEFTLSKRSTEDKQDQRRSSPSIARTHTQRIARQTTKQCLPFASLITAKGNKQRMKKTKKERKTK